MLLTDITQIIRVLLEAFGAVASQDDLTQRRVGQIGEVIGAVEDVAGDEEDDSTIADKRVEEAHDIIHRVAAILAMEDEGGDVDGSTATEGDPEQGDDAPLPEVVWDGTLDGETIELKEDEE